MNSRTKVFRAHRALAWFYAVLGVVISALVIFGSRRDAGISMVLIPVLFVGVFSMHYFTAQACREGKPGGRVASILIACLMLFAIPVGTIVGIYLLANTWRRWEPSSSPA